MIIPCGIEDDTGTMRVTFFRTAAEELIGMKMPGIIEVIQKTGDEGSLEDKVSDLVGHEITVIADASFDEYNEEIRLNAKKLVELKMWIRWMIQIKISEQCRTYDTKFLNWSLIDQYLNSASIKVVLILKIIWIFFIIFI